MPLTQRTQAGLWGEIYAARYLRDNAFEMMAANFRTRFGEIDLIARDENFILFAEVKARAEFALFAPAEAVDVHKQRKIILTAEEFLSRHPQKLQPRFDVIEVLLSRNFKPVKINHILNAFE